MHLYALYINGTQIIMILEYIYAMLDQGYLGIDTYIKANPYNCLLVEIPKCYVYFNYNLF